MFESKSDLENYVKQFLGGRDPSYLKYLSSHSDRFFKSYEIIKKYQNKFDKEVFVDLASANGIFLPILHAICAFKEIHIVDYGKRDAEDLIIQSSTKSIQFKKHYLNLEKDYLPFKDNSVDVIVFFEIIEHLLYDPMHVLLEINRVLKRNGFLFISTPNLSAASAFSRMLKGDNPNFFTPYREVNKIYERHNREFTIKEVKILANNSGFSVEKVITYPIKYRKIKLFIALLNLLGLSNLNKEELGDSMFVVCKKNRSLDVEKMNNKTRFPEPIYRL